MSRNLYLFNCDTNFSQQNCHHSCEECDGPTNEDCLSCSQNSQRIYLPDYKQCICPYFTIDDYDCMSYSDFKLQPISNVEQKMECKYGQFEIDALCQDCPGILNEEVITCLECLLNPKGWSKDPFCQTYLHLNQDGSTSPLGKSENIYYFIFNGIDLELCLECVQSSIIDLNNINQDNNDKLQQFKQFCYAETSSKYCYKCSLLYCKICMLQITGYLTHKWLMYRNIKILVHTMIEFGIIEENNCISPYYISAIKECKRCSINNCLHCFEYVSDDLKQCTLYENFKTFNGDENVKIGCALCEDGYVFDFQFGMCLNQSPKIDTCLRSYINQEGFEICTLSSKQDFSIAKEIINCEQLISNCLQCFITAQSILRCIICKEGYTSTTTEVNGRCYINRQQYAKISIEGDYFQKDAWMQRIQSFLGSFLPNSYFYPKSNSYYIDETAISCVDGYELIEYRRCIKYCNSDCKECKLNLAPAYYYCNQCPLDYYKKPYRVQENGKCLKCSSLCQFCELRTLEEISLIQPNFIVNENNELYSKKCIKPSHYLDVIIQPQQQIPMYCLNQQCANNLLYEFIIKSCGQENYLIDDFSTIANINYLNQIGVQAIIIQLQYSSSNKGCSGPITINSIKLKQNIFSLRTTNLTILGNGIVFINKHLPNKFESFELIYIYNFTVQLSNTPLYFLGNMKLKFTMKDIKIIGNQINQINKLINSEQFESIDLVNITIFGIVFTESSFFKIESQQLDGQIQIKQLFILNCTFINTDLFSISNSQLSISIDNLQVENCILLNSSILKMKQNLILTKIAQISRILIRNCQLSYSYILNYGDQFKLDIVNLQLHQNTFINSSFLIFNYNISITDAIIQENILNSSILIQALDINTTSYVMFQINQLTVFNLTLVNSHLIYFTSFSINMLIQLSNFILQNIETSKSSNKQYNVVKIIHCFSCSIKQVQILNSRNLPIFYFFESNEILIENLIFQQNYSRNQIQYCFQTDIINNQLLFIQGFAFIKLKQLKIENYLNLNQIFIEILSSFQYLEDINENIEISDTLFQNNIIEKVLKRSMLSIISIYSKKKQFILFENLQFQRNFFHQYEDDPTENYAGLIYIDSTQGQITFNNLFCKENAVTNSSTSFIFIISQSILFNNNIISYHNVISQELWSQFYKFDLAKQFDQNQINQIIQQIYPIYVQGGVAKVISEQFVCTNSKYQHILALTSAIFYVKTQGQGFIQFINISIESISSIYRYGTDNFGCININSLNSNLNLEISNTKFLNVLNGMSTVLLSTIQTYIFLKNFFIFIIRSHLINNVQIQIEKLHLFCAVSVHLLEIRKFY